MSAHAGIATGRARAIGIGMVLLGGGCLSISGIIVRHIEQASGWQVMFYRSIGMAAILLLILAIKDRGRVASSFRAMGRGGILLACVLTASSIAYLFSLILTNVANAMFIISSAPFFAAILGWILLKERVQPLTWIAIAAAMIGMGVMFADGFAGGRPLGLFVALIAASTYAFVVVMLRRYRGLDMLPALILSAILAGAVSAFAAGGLAVSSHDMLLGLFMGAVQTAGGFGFIMLGTRRVPAAEASLLLLSEPILGPTWVWIFVSEVPSSVALAGGGVVLGAVLVQAVASVVRERRAAPA